MCTNGSRSVRLTPAKARRTGKPSPSKPLGALVRARTDRSVASPDTGNLGRLSGSADTAGMRPSNDRQSQLTCVAPRLLVGDYLHRVHVLLAHAQDRVVPAKDDDPSVLPLHVHALEPLTHLLCFVAVNHVVRRHDVLHFDASLRARGRPCRACSVAGIRASAK